MKQRIRHNRLGWLLVVLIVVMYGWVGAANHRPPAVVGQWTAPTVTVPPTPIGGIPTTIATDMSHDFPTVDLTVVAGGTATKEPWGGSTPSMVPSATP